MLTLFVYIQRQGVEGRRIGGRGEDDTFLTWLEGQPLIRVGRNQSAWTPLPFDLSPCAQGLPVPQRPSPYRLPVISHLLSVSVRFAAPHTTDNSHGVESTL